jgi:hypothetical protein
MREDWMFDLASDVAEKNDLSKSRPGELERMQALLTKWEIDVKPER